MKTVKEVIEDLQKLPPDLFVYVHADHGQTLIQCNAVSTEHVEKLDYYAETVWDENDEPDTTAPKICVIGD